MRPAKGAALAGVPRKRPMNRRTKIHMALTSVCWAATAVLIVLHASGAIGWPWWWITAPLWGPVAASSLAFAGLALFERVL